MSSSESRVKLRGLLIRSAQFESTLHIAFTSSISWSLIYCYKTRHLKGTNVLISHSVDHSFSECSSFWTLGKKNGKRKITGTNSKPENIDFFLFFFFWLNNLESIPNQLFILKLLLRTPESFPLSPSLISWFDLEVWVQVSERDCERDWGDWAMRLLS